MTNKDTSVLLIIIILIFVCFQCQEPETEDPYQLTLLKIKNIENRFGIRIFYKDFSNKYSSEWLNSYEWTYLSDVELIGFIPKLDSALSKYPAPFIKSNLNEIRIFKSLKSKISTSYLSIKGGEGNITLVINNYPNYFLIYTIHHELAHNVQFFNSNVFPEEEWYHVHEENNNYIFYGAYYDTDTIYADINLYENGFISYYCTASQSEDFAEYASYHYANHDFLMELSEQYAPVKHKYALFKQFYNSLGANIK